MSKTIYSIKNSGSMNYTYFPLFTSNLFLLLREFNSPDWVFTVFYTLTAIMFILWIVSISIFSKTVDLKIGDDLKLYKET